MWFLVIVALFASNAMACNIGCSEYQGICACEQKPIPDTTPPVQPSDDKPAKSGMPSWQDPSVKAAFPQSLIYEDSKADQDRAQADSEGKKAAGIQ